MVTGIIVTGALFAILEFSVHQSSRLSGVAQATQVSRTAMTRIVDELHSACLSTGFTPRPRRRSAPTKLIFVNGYNEKAEPKNRRLKAARPAPAGHPQGRHRIRTKPKAADRHDLHASSNANRSTAEIRIRRQPGEQCAWPNTSLENGQPGRKQKPPIFQLLRIRAPNSQPGRAKPASTLKEINRSKRNATLKAKRSQKVAAVRRRASAPPRRPKKPKPRAPPPKRTPSRTSTTPDDLRASARPTPKPRSWRRHANEPHPPAQRCAPRTASR